MACWIVRLPPAPSPLAHRAPEGGYLPRWAFEAQLRHAGFQKAQGGSAHGCQEAGLPPRPVPEEGGSPREVQPCLRRPLLPSLLLRQVEETPSIFKYFNCYS